MRILWFYTLALVSVASTCSPGPLIPDQHEVQGYIQRRAGLASATPTSKTGLRNVHIFNGHTFRSGSLAMQGGKITFDLHNVDSWIDGQDGYLIPGLIDSHCHPASISDLATLSSYGVTTAMSMGCPSYPLCASLRDQPGLTSFFTASAGIVGPNSTHALVMHVDPDTLIRSASQAPQFVSWAFGNNSDFIKIIAETNGPDQATQDAIVSETHRLGRQAMTHAADIRSYLQAIASGTDGIQHTPGDGNITPAMIEDMRHNGQFIVPTTTVVKAFLNSAVLPLSSYNNRSWPTVIGNLKSMHRARLPLVVGTDAVSLNDPFAALVKNPLGSTMHDELEVFVNEVGFEPAEALRAATSLPARLFGLADRGLLMEGKRADLVLLGSNPLKNISATRDIMKVWNGGIEYNSAA
ncbi:hypothetical protein G647_08721 [Cladophialophora carrionii CBS 160.54]|uniref:Amidohydrolase-related domain-containing protein n=1 Tax=Cladophialophora carrionii CBS 160.54 TaxID=1279043 RepID=V9D093_9EURO|nr:uncharacterized protein G647_08721 [Cladophialophora carrionii CBS 160.54]ETI19708.1 hypothetical protein G647_08721 [Cladophialophora carrionii CBS 160.54]